MSIIAVRDAWVQAAKALLPQLAECSAYGGRFDERELAARSIRLPAVRIAVLRIPSGEAVGNGQRDVPAEFVAYILTRDVPSLGRDDAALSISEAICARLHLGVDLPEGVAAADPERVIGQNLYSRAADGKGFALWAVTWNQLVRIGTAPDEPAIVPARVYLGLAPDVGADHVADYQQIV